MKSSLLIFFLFILFQANASDLSSGYPCSQQHFYAITSSGDIEEMEVSGGAVISHGIVLSSVPGSALAFCNNVDGGSYSPTFYSSTSTNVSRYNGSTWDTVNFTPQTYMGGCGGYGNNLFYTQPGSNHPYIYTYSAGVLTGITIAMAPAAADLAVDANGDIWYFAGSNQNTSRIRQLSPNGTLLKEFSCSIDTYNAYGCFLLNGVLYLGLGQYNTVHPNTLIPITFTVDSAFLGIPMNMPGTNYNDLASCSPGLLTGVEENSFNKSFSIYPNPASDHMSIYIISPITKFSIYDVRGIKLKSEFISSQSNEIDISSLTNGIYFIECETSQGIIRRKFIKES